MPIRIDNDLPAKAALEEENVFVMDKERACTQDIRPLKIAILNLMPNKLDTELHLLRSLSNTPLQLDITFLQTESYVPTHVTSTLHICWAAQAGLYYHYGIKKHILNKKISGVYEHHPLHNKLPIIRGFDDKFYVPHSRNTGVDGEAIRKNKELTIVAESDETGPYIILNSTGSQVFVTGHPEYDVMSLHYEYVRDVKRGLNPDIPKNYYKDDDPTKKPVKSWRCHANAMYYNWLNYYVYQVTPYDLEKDK